MLLPGAATPVVEAFAALPVALGLYMEGARWMRLAPLADPPGPPPGPPGVTCPGAFRFRDVVEFAAAAWVRLARSLAGVVGRVVP